MQGLPAVKKSQRKIVVLTSLVGVLTATSALLLALAPPPISGETAYDNLWAADGDASRQMTDALFNTRVPVRQGEWKFIYIHHSDTVGGNAMTLAGDHFVIGNGYGLEDGQIQLSQRWNNQLRAAAPAGLTSIDPACISICLVGDLNATNATPAQLRRLAQLVTALQAQLAIGGDKVVILTDAGAAATIGAHFPQSQLRQQILP
jgi:hypothetical protein